MGTAAAPRAFLPAGPLPAPRAALLSASFFTGVPRSRPPASRDGSRLSSPLPPASKCTLSADVYRLAVSGELTIARDVLLLEMPEAEITPDARAKTVMKMSPSELDAERCALLHRLMAHGALGSAEMLAESMRRNAVLPDGLEPLLREHTQPVPNAVSQTSSPGART